MYVLHHDAPQDCQRFLVGLPCLSKYCSYVHNYAGREMYLHNRNRSEGPNIVTSAANNFNIGLRSKNGHAFKRRHMNESLTPNADETSDYRTRYAHYPVLNEIQVDPNSSWNHYSTPHSRLEARESIEVYSSSLPNRRSSQASESRETQNCISINSRPNAVFACNHNPFGWNSNGVDGFDIYGYSFNPSANAPGSDIRKCRHEVDSGLFSYVKISFSQNIAQAASESKPIVNLPKSDNRTPCRPKKIDQKETSNFFPENHYIIDGDTSNSSLAGGKSFPIECSSKPEHYDEKKEDAPVAHCTDLPVGCNPSSIHNISDSRGACHIIHTSHSTGHELRLMCHDWHRNDVPEFDNTSHPIGQDLKQKLNDGKRRDVFPTNKTSYPTGYNSSSRHNNCYGRNLSHDNHTKRTTDHEAKIMRREWHGNDVPEFNNSSHPTGQDLKRQLSDGSKRDIFSTNKTNRSSECNVSSRYNNWDGKDVSHVNRSSHHTEHDVRLMYLEWFGNDLPDFNNTSRMTEHEMKLMRREWHGNDVPDFNNPSHPTGQGLKRQLSDGNKRDIFSTNKTNHSSGCNVSSRYNNWDGKDVSHVNHSSHPTEHEVGKMHLEWYGKDVPNFNNKSHPTGLSSNPEHSNGNTRDTSLVIDASHPFQQDLKSEIKDGNKKNASDFNSKIHSIGYKPKPRLSDGNQRDKLPISCTNNSVGYKPKPRCNDGDKKDLPLAIDTKNLTERKLIPNQNDGNPKGISQAINSNNLIERKPIPNHNDENPKHMSQAIDTINLTESKKISNHTDRKSKDTSPAADTSNSVENKQISNHTDGKPNETSLASDTNNMAENKQISDQTDEKPDETSLATDTNHLAENKQIPNHTDGKSRDISALVNSNQSKECSPKSKCSDNKEISVATPVHHIVVKRSTKQKIADFDAKFQVREVDNDSDQVRMEWINNLSPEIKQAYFRNAVVEKNVKPPRRLSPKAKLLLLPSSKSCEQSFTLFPKLPSEIRNQIWNFAKIDCARTCYVQLDIKQQPGGRCQIINGKNVLIPNPVLDAKFSYFYDIPGLFGACRESKSIVKDLYGKNKIIAFNQATKKPFLSGHGSCIFNYEQDRLFFLTRGTISRLPEYVDFMMDDERDKIRHLAIPLKDYFHERRTTVDSLVKFRYLKTLNLVIGDGKEDKQVIGSEDYSRSLRNDMRAQNINDDRDLLEQNRDKWSLPYVKIEYVNELQARSWGINDLRWEATWRPIRR